MEILSNLKPVDWAQRLASYDRNSGRCFSCGERHGELFDVQVGRWLVRTHNGPCRQKAVTGQRPPVPVGYQPRVPRVMINGRRVPGFRSHGTREDRDLAVTDTIVKEFRVNHQVGHRIRIPADGTQEIYIETYLLDSAGRFGSPNRGLTIQDRFAEEMAAGILDAKRRLRNNAEARRATKTERKATEAQIVTAVVEAARD